MSFTALALLLGAGVLNAPWDRILKRSSERLLVSDRTLLAGALAFASLVVEAWLPPPGVWPLAAASCAVCLVYFTGLSPAYGRGDFSIINPAARGAAPVILTVWAVFFLGERPSPMGLLGITTILGGLEVLGGAPLLSRRCAAGTSPGPRWCLLRGHGRSAGLALGVALCISVYTALDGAGVRLWQPILYAVLVCQLAPHQFYSLGP